MKKIVLSFVITTLFCSKFCFALSIVKVETFISVEYQNLTTNKKVNGIVALETNLATNMSDWAPVREPIKKCESQLLDWSTKMYFICEIDDYSSFVNKYEFSFNSIDIINHAENSFPMVNEGGGNEADFKAAAAFIRKPNLLCELEKNELHSGSFNPSGRFVFNTWVNGQTPTVYQEWGELYGFKAEFVCISPDSPFEIYKIRQATSLADSLLK